MLGNEIVTPLGVQNGVAVGVPVAVAVGVGVSEGNQPKLLPPSTELAGLTRTPVLLLSDTFTKLAVGFAGTTTFQRTPPVVDASVRNWPAVPVTMKLLVTVVVEPAANLIVCAAVVVLVKSTKV